MGKFLMTSTLLFSLAKWLNGNLIPGPPASKLHYFISGTPRQSGKMTRRTRASDNHSKFQIVDFIQKPFGFPDLLWERFKGCLKDTWHTGNHTGKSTGRESRKRRAVIPAPHWDPSHLTWGKSYHHPSGFASIKWGQ